MSFFPPPLGFRCCPITEPVMKGIVIILGILWKYSGKTGDSHKRDEYWSIGLTCWPNSLGVEYGETRKLYSICGKLIP